MKFLLRLNYILFFTSFATAEPNTLNGAKIRQLLSDKTIYSMTTATPSEQLFQKAGTTYYSENGNQSQGNWKIDGDKYCSVWPPSENWVCFDVTQTGNMINFISPSGSISTFHLSK
jgi:hypothetical protein